MPLGSLWSKATCGKLRWQVTGTPQPQPVTTGGRGKTGLDTVRRLRVADCVAVARARTRKAMATFEAAHASNGRLFWARPTVARGCTGAGGRMRETKHGGPVLAHTYGNHACAQWRILGLAWLASLGRSEPPWAPPVRARARRRRQRHARSGSHGASVGACAGCPLARRGDRRAWWVGWEPCLWKFWDPGFWGPVQQQHRLFSGRALAGGSRARASSIV